MGSRCSAPGKCLLRVGSSLCLPSCSPEKLQSGTCTASRTGRQWPWSCPSSARSPRPAGRSSSRSRRSINHFSHTHIYFWFRKQVLLMRNCLATQIVLRHLLRLDRQQQDLGSCSHDGCGGFLCGRTAGCWVEGSRLTSHQVLAALVHVIIVIAGEPEGGGAKTLHTALAPLLQQVKKS